MPDGYGGAVRRFNRLVRTLRTLALALALSLGVGAVSAEAAGPVRVLALGDSLVAGYGLSRSDSFVAVLQAALDERGIEARIIDGGVSGDTTAGGLARLDWLIAGENPDAVLVELGANDGLRAIDPESTRANLAAILDRLREGALPVLFAGMLAPPNLGEEYGRDFNAVFPALAEEYAVPFYPFFLDGVAAEPDLNQRDGIHPNAEGVRVIVERILPFMERLIERAQEKRTAERG